MDSYRVLSLLLILDAIIQFDRQNWPAAAVTGPRCRLPRAVSRAGSLGRDSCPFLCAGLENTVHYAAPQPDRV